MPSGRTRAAFISLIGSYAGSALTILKGIVFVPWYLHALGADTYGAWLASGNVVGLLGVFDAGVSSVIYQRLGDAWGAADRPRFSRIVGAAGLIIAAIASTIILTGTMLADVVPRLVRAPVEAWRPLSLAFLLATWGAAGSIAATNLFAVSAAWQKSELGAITRISGQVVETGTIALGLWRGWGVVSLGLGACAGAALSLLVGGAWTARSWRKLKLDQPRTRRADLAELARATAPLMLSRVVLQIDGNVEVALVAAFINPSAAAVYAITDRILRTAMSFISPIAGSVMSGLSHFVGERGLREASKPARELIAVWSFIVAAALPPLLALNEDFTTLWVGRANYGGLGLNTALFFNELLGGREWLYSVLLISCGAVATAAWISTIESIVRVPLMYVALRQVGWIGLPSAQAAVSLIALGFYSFYASRRLHIPVSERVRLALQGAWPVLASFSLGAVEAFALPHASRWPTLIAKSAAIGSLHLGLALTLAANGRRALARRLAAGRPWVARPHATRSVPVSSELRTDLSDVAPIRRREK